MKDFAALLDRLVLTPSRNQKLALMVDYFLRTPDPERGYALAAITRDLEVASVKPALLRALVAERMDEELFRLSYDYVGDLAETIALVWDAEQRTANTALPSPQDEEAGAVTNTPTSTPPPSLTTVVETLNRLGKADAMKQLTIWLDQLDASGRYALLKLATGGMRIGVSARLAKLALADFGARHINVDIIEIEELWHGLDIPYVDLFQWLSGQADKPSHRAAAPFRPVMLANPLNDGDMRKLDADHYAAEWKWDGIRVQVTSEAGVRRLYSRTGDDIGRAFPDLIDAMDFDGSLDGELLVGRPVDDATLAIGSFSDLQQRLNRKTVSKKLLQSHPVMVRCYDLLALGDRNLRGEPFEERREQLESFVPQLDPIRFDLSPLLPFETWDDLAQAREDVP
ncbi:MAG: cisplatin damage response ATP-dependent DNA ligase, partial [Pseudomonadota bacterium]